MQSTLVLNASYAPLSIVSAQRAVILVRAGKAVSIDDSPRVFRSENLEVSVPYVIQLKDYVDKQFTQRASFSRRGMLVRDNFTCVYCGRPGDTMDHVIPRAKGGVTSYENCVTACRRCNHKKSDKTLAQMGWTLPFTPAAPSWYTVMLHKTPAGSEAREVWTRHIAVYDPKVALSLA